VRPRRLCLLLVLFLLSASPAAAGESAPPILADEIVAVVEKVEILLTDVELEARLSRARREGFASLAQAPDAQALGTALAQIIDELVVVGEADRLQVFRVAPGEIDRGVSELRTSIGHRQYDQFMADHEVDALTIREMVQRGLRARHYLEGRFRLASRPKDTDVAAYFGTHAEEFKGRKLEEMTDLIRERLSREHFDDLTRAFVADVRRRANVRILRAPGASSGETPMSGHATAADVGAARSGE